MGTATQTDIPQHNIIHGAPEGQDARILAEKARALMPQDRVLVHIALDDTRISILSELLAFFAPDVDIITLPAWDCLPYDRVSPHGDIVAARVCALTGLMAWEHQRERAPRILLTSVNAALQRVMPRETLREASFTAKTGASLDIKKLQLFLAQNGYNRSETVREPGDYAIRGGIIDLFPAGHAQPLRIDLFGDEIDTIKTFDPVTQRTQDTVKSFSLQPASEFFLDEDSIARFRAKYRELFGVVQKDDPLYAAVSEGRRYNGMEHWLPLFYDHMDTIFDYAPNAAVTFDPHANDAYSERMEQVADFFNARQILETAAKKQDKKNKATLSGSVYHPLSVQALYVEAQEWQGLTHEATHLSTFGAPDESTIDDAGARKGRDFSDVRALPDGDVFAELKKYISHQHTQGKKILIAAYSDGSKTRLKGLIENINTKKYCRYFQLQGHQKTPVTPNRHRRFTTGKRFYRP